MSQAFEPAETRTRSVDRRAYSRQMVRSLAYIELGEGNGGIVLNVSEGGLAVQAVMSITTDHLPQMRVQLAHTGDPIEARGRIAWAVDLGKRAGIEFVGLDPEAHARLQEWVSMETDPGRDYQPENNPQEEPEASETAMPAVGEMPEAVPPASLSSEAASSRRKLALEPPPDFQQPVRSTTPVPTRPRHPHVRVPSSASYPALDPVEAPRRPASSPKATEASSIQTRTVFAGLFVIVAALAVAWAAGYGTFRSKSVGIDADASPRGTDNSQASLRPETNSAMVSEIEIVDGKNQRWVIPFAGPLGLPEANRLRPPVGITAGAAKDRASFQLSPLAPPTRSNPGNAAPPTPPAVAAPDNLDNAPPSAILDSRSPSPPPLTQPTEPHAESVAYGELLVRVEPVYPASAIASRIEGTVKLRAAVDRYGTVTAVEPVSGPSTLISAALAAVRQWRYAPTLIDGQPVQAEKQITIVFRLTQPH